MSHPSSVLGYVRIRFSRKYNIIIFITFTGKLCRKIKLTNSTDARVYNNNNNNN